MGTSYLFLNHDVGQKSLMFGCVTDTTFEQLIFRLHRFIYSRNLRGTKKSRDRISKVSPVHFLRRQTQNCSLVNSKMSGSQNESAHCFMLMGWGGVRERSLDIFRGGHERFSVASGRRRSTGGASSRLLPPHLPAQSPWDSLWEGACQSVPFALWSLY